MKIKKTNAMRHLDDLKADYTPFVFDLKEAADAETVAGLLNMDPASVFKTLVTQANDREYLVFLLPADGHLSLKKAAKAAGKKSVEMIPMKDLLKTTGYVHGGCSPFGMKKTIRTWIDESALSQEEIAFSGGKIGVQIRMKPADFLNCAKAETADLCGD